MHHHIQENDNIKLSVPKLIALWAFSECALGGILHAFQFPFSGLLLAGFAVTIICAIGYTSEKPGQDILYGTMIAIAVKLSLSPHSPITAYLAVGFQGACGAAFFSFQKHNRFAYMLFGCIALVESALQKLLTLWLIFGNALWNSINLTANQIIKSLGGGENYQYSLYFLLIYTLIYASWGAIIGAWAYNLPARIKNVDRTAVQQYANSNITYNHSKSGVLWSLIICLLLIMCSYLFILGESSENLIWIIARPFIIISVWYFIFHPICIYFIRKFIKNQQGSFSLAVDNIQSQIPKLRRMTQQAAGYTSVHYNGISRIQYFIIILILLACEDRGRLEG